MRVAAASFTRADEGYRQAFEFTSRGAFTTTVLPIASPIASPITSPIASPIGGVVICPSLFVDQYLDHRLEVLLARRIARLGIAVCRFHYRGTGNSQGDASDMTWESLLEDAHDAQEQLAPHLDADAPMGVVGARFGSLIALALGAEKPEMPLALWAPTPDVAAYLHDLRRAERMARITDADGNAADAYVCRPPTHLVARAAELSIEAIAGTGVGDVLVVRTGHGAPSADDQRAADALRAVAASVEVREHTDEDAWWARGKLKAAESMAPRPLLDDTAAWLHHTLAIEKQP